MQARGTVALLGILGSLLLSITASANSAYSKGCLPFFDYSKDQVVSNVVSPTGSMHQGRVDITPEPMPINAFGEAVLRACGPLGSRVSPLAVQKLADRFSPDLMKQLAREFHDYNDMQLRALVADAWIDSNGFEHVFCGQPKRDKVGGLHYANRYFELQERGQLCRLDNNVMNEEILPQSVYTIGITTSSGIVDRKKGFSTRQTAEDIFFEGARTYLRNCMKPSKNRRVCVSRFHQDGSFGSLFVCAPGNGIVTFYPLAKSQRGNPDCR